MCLGVGPVINQHSASSNAVLSPVMDAILVVRIGALDVAALDAVVEGLRREVGNVPEPIPLRPGLGVAHVEIVVGHSGRSALIWCWNLSRANAGVSGTLSGRLSGTISPVLISFAAAATRVGVSRLSRPICIDEGRSISDYCPPIPFAFV